MPDPDRHDHPRRRADWPVPAARKEALPPSRPKPIDEDPEARERIRRIMESPSYVRADRDLRLLERDELRPVRLQLEYLKPELELAAHGVNSTVVVFGGTRILERAEAERRLAEARRKLAERPGDPELGRAAGAAERVLAKSRYYDVAREFARLVSRVCQKDERCDYVVVTGGGPGVMEAANRGAFDAGAKSVGLNITLPHEQFPNPYITPGLSFQFRYFALRKLHFLKRAKAMVAFPGGYGTFDELFETMTLVQTRVIEPIPIVLAGESFWRRAFDADFLVSEGVIDPEDARLFSFADTAEEIWDAIVSWYRELGEELDGSAT
jgi:uncharacterized protein (TIGR00730 family)